MSDRPASDTTHTVVDELKPHRRPTRETGQMLVLELDRDMQTALGLILDEYPDMKAQDLALRALEMYVSRALLRKVG